MNNFTKTVKKKWLGKTVTTLLLIAILIASYFVLNFFVAKIKLNPIDLTDTGIYSLTKETKRLIKDEEEPIDIYFYNYLDDTLPEFKIGKLYNNVNKNIKVKKLKNSDDITKVNKFGLDINERAIVVSMENGKFKVIPSTDIYLRDDLTGKITNIVEQKITNAIVDLIAGKEIQVCMLKGHKEYNTDDNGIYSKMMREIKNEYGDINQIDLITEQIPENCDVFMIVNPQMDFSSIETEKLEKYINNGGNIIWLQDPISKDFDISKAENINKVLDLYGMNFGNGMVLEGDPKAIVLEPFIIIPQLSYNDIVKNIYTDSGLIFPGATIINNVSDEKDDELKLTKKVMAKTSPKAFYQHPGDNKKTEQGQYILSEEVIKKVSDDKNSKLIAIANAVFTTDIPVLNNDKAVDLRANKDFVLNSIAYLTNQEDTIRIRKPYTDVRIDRLSDQKQATVILIVFLVPLIIIIIGIVVYIMRKYKGNKCILDKEMEKELKKEKAEIRAEKKNKTKK